MTTIHAFKRSKTYVHTFPDVTLKFEPNSLGDVVCDVEDESAVNRLLSIPTGFKLYVEVAREEAFSLDGEEGDLGEGENPYLIVSGDVSIDLMAMNKAELREMCEANGIKVGGAASEQTLRDRIVAAINTPE